MFKSAVPLWNGGSITFLKSLSYDTNRICLWKCLFMQPAKNLRHSGHVLSYLTWNELSRKYKAYHTNWVINSNLSETTFHLSLFHICNEKSHPSSTELSVSGAEVCPRAGLLPLQMAYCVYLFTLLVRGLCGKSFSPRLGSMRQR